MKTEYRTIRIDSLNGLKTAEILKARGWSVVQVGFNTVVMSKTK
jgi:hypothetical protein